MTRSRFLRNTPRISKPSKAALTGMGITVAALGASALALGIRSAVRSRNRWTGKTVVITGGSRGLGFALAAEFGRAGANLVLVARDRDELLSAQRLLVSRGDASDGQIRLAAYDLKSRVQAEQMIEGALQGWGRVDVLVNNAGIIRVGPAATQTVEDFIETMDTNFYAMLYCTWAVLPHMIERGDGDIINITSFGGKVAVPHMLAYSASKFAATGFSEGLHTEVKSKGVHVTTVCPGLLRTGSHLNAEFKGQHDEEYRWFSMGATLPFLSVDAARAARLIVSAAARRDAELIISPQAALGVRMAALMPNTTAGVLTLVNRLLPKGGGDRDGNTTRPGSDSRSKELGLVDTLGSAAAARYNQS